MRYYIGIDLGTSAVKLLLCNKQGEIIKSVSGGYPISFPFPGWSEQNPADWLSETLDALKELTADVDKAAIRGIGIGGQMHGLVILDENDSVIRPAILWNDGRTSKETHYLNDTIGEKTLAAETGNIAFAGFTAPKLLWLRENEPENFKKIKKIMLPKDYLVYMLTGVHATDVSDASGMLLFDVKNKRWSEKMLEICSVTEKQMPQIFESADKVGTLKHEYAEKLGLNDHVIICAGAGDNAAAAIGTGTVGEGRCNISLGTSGTLFVSSENFSLPENHALHSFAHADGHYHLMGCMLSAAACNGWWMDKILGEKDYAGAQADISDDMLGNNRVVFLPYLMGERSPHNDPAARGVFIGMSMGTTRTDMTLAVLEGVAFGMRDSFEAAKKAGAKIERSMICGGGAKSPLWRRIFASVMNIPVDVPVSEEGPGLGGALLAAVACGEYKSVKEAADAAVKIRETVLPDPEIAARYDVAYNKFTEIYPAVRAIF